MRRASACRCRLDGVPDDRRPPMTADPTAGPPAQGRPPRETATGLRVAPTASGTVTVDVAGAVVVRIDGAGPAELGAIERQIGPSTEGTGREPDLVIRFEERIPRDGGLRLIGVHDAGFTDDRFLLLRGRQKSPAVVQVGFDPATHPIEVVCERGLRSVPLLIPLVNLAALRRGIVPVHGALVVHEDRGILVVGWSKGGKTETVLAFMDAGASFVGDEWVYVHPDGTGTGIPEPTRIWDWQLKQFPEVRGRIERRTRARLWTTGHLADLLARTASSRSVGRSVVGDVARRGEPIVRAQASVQRFPRQLYGADRLRPSARIDVVMAAVSRADELISLRDEPLERLIDRIAISNEHERLDLHAAIDKYRFAFPEAPVLDPGSLTDRERDLLRGALAGRPGWILEHPYPPDIRSLYVAARPVLRST